MMTTAPRQLVFDFFDGELAAPRPWRTTSYWRRRIDRASRAAYAMGLKKRAHAESVAAELLGASPGFGPEPRPIPRPAPVMPFYPDRESRCELAALARRVRNLIPSRTNPESYFIEKDAIFRELQRIAKIGTPESRRVPDRRISRSGAELS